MPRDTGPQPRCRRLMVGAGAAALALVIAACGSSPPTPSTPSLPGHPIKIMTIYPKGGLVPLPEIPEGADAAVQAINERGGIDGRPLQLLVCSDGNNANTAADCARKAVEERVLALVGTASTYGTVFMPIMSKHRIPSLGNVPSNEADFVSTAAFPITGGPTTVFAALPRFLADAGARRITLVYPDLGAASLARLKADMGLEPKRLKIASAVAVPVTAPDMSTYVAQALTGGADGIVVILPGTQATNFVQAARQTAPRVRIAMASTEPGPVHEALGDAAEGIIQALDEVPVPEVATDAGRRYAAEMKAAGHDDLSGYRLNSWLAVQVLAKLANDLPKPTAPALWGKLIRTSGLRTGLTPPLQWKQGNVGGAPRSFSGCAMAVALTADGKRKPVTGKFFNAFTDSSCPTP